MALSVQRMPPSPRPPPPVPMFLRLHYCLIDVFVVILCWSVCSTFSFAQVIVSPIINIGAVICNTICSWFSVSAYPLLVILQVMLLPVPRQYKPISKCDLSPSAYHVPECKPQLTERLHRQRGRRRCTISSLLQSRKVERRRVFEFQNEMILTHHHYNPRPKGRRVTL